MKMISHIDGMFPTLLTDLAKERILAIGIICPDHVDACKLMDRFRLHHLLKWATGEEPSSFNSNWLRHQERTAYVLRYNNGTYIDPPAIRITTCNTEFLEEYIKYYPHKTIPVLHAKALIS
jgi:hypothetical protein